MFVGILMYFSAFLCYWLHRKNNQLQHTISLPFMTRSNKTCKAHVQYKKQCRMQILEGKMWQQQLIQTCESGRYHLSQEHGELINVHDWYQSFTAICCPPKASSDKQMSKRKDRRKGKRGRVEAESTTVLVDSTTLQYPLCWTTALFLPFVCQ